MGSICPACGAVGEPGGLRCAQCGLDLTGPDAAQLSELNRQIGVLDHQRWDLWERRRVLAERVAWSWAPPAVPGEENAFTPWAGQPEQPAPRWPPAPSAGRAPEWTIDRVRSWLLWVGAALVTVSALAFTTVAWSHLGDAGRALLLALFTAVGIGGALALRRRLPATAEACSGLSIGLCLVDWEALRHAGLTAGLSGSASWAIGSLVVAVVAYVLGRAVGRRVSRVAIAALVPLAGALAVMVVAGAPWSGALGLAVLAAAVTLARDIVAEPDDRLVDAVLALHAWLAWTIAAILAFVASALAGTFVQSLLPAAAVLGLAATPLLRAHHARGAVFNALATSVWLIVAGVAVAIMPRSLSGEGGLLWLAAVGSVAFVVAAWMPVRWTAPGRVAAGVWGVSGLGFGVAAALRSVFGPLAWFDDSWRGTFALRARDAVAGAHSTTSFHTGWAAVAVLVLVAVALVIGTTRATRPAWVLPAGAATLAAAVCLAPVVGGGSVGLAWATTLGATSLIVLGAAVLDRTRPRGALALLSVAMLPAVATAGWAASVRSASTFGLGALLVVGIVATAVARSDDMRAELGGVAGAAAVAFVAIVTAAGGATGAVCGFAAAVAGSAVLLVGVLARPRAAERLTLELAGVTGLLVGVLVAAADPVWAAAALTIATPLLVVATAARSERATFYAVAAGIAAVGATWAWLAAAHVSTVEAYTVPAAAFALGMGVVEWRRGPARSWLSLGPAIVLGLGPTWVLGIARDEPLRIAIAAAVATVVVLAGAWKRLQAPLALGSLALLGLAIDALGPALAQLPRWVPPAVAGLLLMWVGATFETSRERARRATQTLMRLG